MNLVIEGFNFQNKEYYQKTLDVRSEVFVNELKFDKFLEFDAMDNKAMHYILFYNQITAGCARWNETPTEITINRFCILNQFRKKGLGHLFIKFILDDIIASKKEIKMLSTSQMLDFFLKNNFVDLQQNESLGSITYHILKLK